MGKVLYQFNLQEHWDTGAVINRHGYIFSESKESAERRLKEQFGRVADDIVVYLTETDMILLP